MSCKILTTPKISPATLKETMERRVPQEPAAHTEVNRRDNRPTENELSDFAWLGRLRTRQERASGTGTTDIFDRLAMIADPECWGGPCPESLSDVNVLHYYIYRRFDQAVDDGTVILDTTGRASVFNTGLVTARQEDIYAFFVPNEHENREPWYLKGWYTSGESHLRSFSDLPEPATYSANPADYYLDWNLPLRFRSYILRQSISELFPNAAHEIPYGLELAAGSAIDRARKLAERTPGTAVPSWNPQRAAIQLLLPFFLTDPAAPDAALIVSRVDDSYSGEEIIPLATAYRRARLLARPYPPWLTTRRSHV